MLRLTAIGLFLFLCGSWAPFALAHYNMLFPEIASVKRGDAVTFVYRWGHPFEHQMFNAPAPESVFVLSPDGKKTDLTKTLEKVAEEGTDKKPVTAFRFRLTPEERGDFIFVLNTPPIWMEEEQELWQDTVKVVLHVQAQRGWDTPTGQELEVTPLTRPYGMESGMVFQAQVEEKKPSAEARPGNVFRTPASPVAGIPVEVERFNPSPPLELPPDEHITRTAKTDPNGVVTCSLMEPGWWGITAQRTLGTREHDGKSYPVRQRATLWVFVDEKVTGKSAP